MSEEIKPIVSASYTRKINHDMYGGFPYENSEFFCSIRRQCEKGKEAEAYRELVALAKEEVVKATASEIQGMMGGLPAKEFQRMLDDYLQGKSWGTADDFAGMSQFQQTVFQELKKSKKRINYKGGKKIVNI